MYQASIFNNGVETVVHYPSANKDDPHLNKLPLKEGLSIVDSLSFSVYPNNQGYDKVFELSTKVKVIDLRDNTIRFTGRILTIDEKMDNDGKIYKDIACEGALSYLNDTKQRGSSYYDNTVAGFLAQILNNHNSKVEINKQIFLGNVDIPGNVIHSCNYETTLAEILKVRETNGGNIRIRENNGILYMDWLRSFDSSIIEVSLGVNMKDMIISKDVTNFGTRIIPLGANNLTIESVNNGYDYIEEYNAKNLYGVIEKTIEYKDVEDPTVLKNTCVSDLPNHTQPSYVLKSNALDLSFITKNKADQFVLDKKLNIINRYMAINAVYNIVELSLDLLSPYNPTLTIANKPVKLTSAITDLRRSTIQNDGIYNNVQIGKSFGIRAVRNDNKVTTTINATEGISIQNEAKKVFYVDINGKLVAVDIVAEGGNFKNIKVNEGTFTDITAEGGTFNNITAAQGLTITDRDSSCTINQNGIKLHIGGYTTTITVKDGQSAVEFADDVIVGKGIFVDGISYFHSNIELDSGTLYLSNGAGLHIGGKDIETIIDNRINELVKEEALK